MKVNFDLGLTREIIAEASKRGVLRNALAYVLATGYWESDSTMRPIREAGGEKYLKAKKYYPYVGMGLPQVTWSYNYKMVANKLELAPETFLKNPNGLLDPKVAVQCIVRGMIEGWYTGKKLGDYFSISASDWLGARRIINGTDKAATIAEIAKAYDAALLAIGYGVGGTPTFSVPSVTPLAVPAAKVDNPSLLAKVASKLGVKK